MVFSDVTQTCKQKAQLNLVLGRTTSSSPSLLKSTFE